jgi:hypothetical protein
MEERLGKEELTEFIAVLMEDEGFSIYEVETEEEYKPDFLAVYKDDEHESQVAVQVEDCDTLKTEEAEKRAKTIAEHCRKSGEGYLFVVPIGCEELGREKFESWGISDVAEFLPIGLKFEEETDEIV